MFDVSTDAIVGIQMPKYITYTTDTKNKRLELLNDRANNS